MTVLHQVDSRPCLGTPDDTHHLAFRHVGSRLCGTLQEGSLGLNPHAHRSRQIY
jgi:hypothetical protein